jgi:hypothetical protein
MLVVIGLLAGAALVPGLPYDDRLARFVIGCQTQLASAHLEEHDWPLTNSVEEKSRPFDGDLSGANTEEATKLDDPGHA